MRTRMSGGVRGVRSNAAPISIIVITPVRRVALSVAIDIYAVFACFVYDFSFSGE